MYLYTTVLHDVIKKHVSCNLIPTPVNTTTPLLRPKYFGRTVVVLTGFHRKIFHLRDFWKLGFSLLRFRFKYFCGITTSKSFLSISDLKACVIIDYRGEWKHTDCSDRFPFVCMKRSK